MGKTPCCAFCSGEPICGATRPGPSNIRDGKWTCTLRKRHRGPHLALNQAHEVKATWRRPARSQSKKGARK